MPDLFSDFDFGLLDDPDFREDSVREELVVPLLASLGFSASTPFRIIRSKPLEHPYVYIGTAKKGITIIPDYLLEREGKYAWILDAKAPNENIDFGKNVEQAYSYAIHRDVRVPLYALCNGRKLVVFDVSKGPPVIDVPLQDIGREWLRIIGLLGCRSAWPLGIRPGFRPDLGLAVAKAGLAVDENGKKFMHMMMSVRLTTVGRVEDSLYCVSGICDEESPPGFIVTFDFGPDEYPNFLSKLTPDVAEQVRTALSRQPYTFTFRSLQEAPDLAIAGSLGDTAYTNENESYIPFVVDKFIC